MSFLPDKIYAPSPSVFEVLASGFRKGSVAVGSAEPRVAALLSSHVGRPPAGQTTKALYS